MSDNRESLEGNEVISMSQSLLTDNMFKTEQFLKELQHLIREKIQPKPHKQIPNHHIDDWLKEGRNCEMLAPNQNWRKGKLRIKLELEFIPDEPDLEEENKTTENQSLNEFRN